jgi:thiosulfate/3-mercaptopyruvate sulfurtransferase
VRLLDGGRRFWVEHDLPTTRAAPDPPTVTYEGSGVDTSVRARRDGVRRALDTHTKLVDVRLPDEYRGARTALPGGEESAVRGGHVPGARNIVWSKNTRADGRFRSRDELEALYATDGVTPGDDVITYCRIGERSAVTWFVLTQLLGYDSVRNYDGSWVEWGNLVGVPVERGA